MPSRLPIILSQCNNRSHRSSEFEEQLIAKLIDAKSLDVSLVAPLDRIEPHTTDHLCLTGILGDLALLTWTESSEAAEQLCRLGISGKIVVILLPTDTAPSIEPFTAPSEPPQHKTTHPAIVEDNAHAEPPQPTRRIYLLNLSLASTPGSITNALCRLRDDRNTKTYNLTLPPIRPRPATEGSSRKTTVSLSGQPISPVTTNQPTATPTTTLHSEPNTAPPPTHPTDIANQPGHASHTSWDHLDQLVDDLDNSSI